MVKDHRTDYEEEMLIQLWMGKLMDLLILILWKILRDKGMNLL